MNLDDILESTVSNGHIDTSSVSVSGFSNPTGHEPWIKFSDNMPPAHQRMLFLFKINGHIQLVSGYMTSDNLVMEFGKNIFSTGKLFLDSNTKVGNKIVMGGAWTHFPYDLHKICGIIIAQNL